MREDGQHLELQIVEIETHKIVLKSLEEDGITNHFRDEELWRKYHKDNAEAAAEEAVEEEAEATEEVAEEAAEEAATEEAAPANEGEVAPAPEEAK